MRICKSITDWYLGNNKEVEKEVPKTGFCRVCYLIWNHFGKLFIINLIFLLCCIPIITIPAALCGLNRYLIQMYQKGYGFETSDYLHEFRLQLKKSIPIGIPLALLLLYGYYLLRMSYEFQVENQVFFIRVIAIACILFVILFGNFCFVLLATVDLPNRYVVKNALILMICEWKAGLMGLSCVMISGIIFLQLFPYSILFPLLGYASITQIFVCSSIFQAVQRRIIEPYEQLMKKSLS